MESRQWSDKGRIRILSVMPIQYDQGSAVTDDRAEKVSRWKQELSNLMPHAAFAADGGISVVTLSELQLKRSVKEAA
jgi:hypothetical protein